MTVGEYAVPAHVAKHLASMGYALDRGMDPFIAEWWAWYTGDDPWHKVEYTTQQGLRRSRDRLSLHPARRVCREWASLLLNEDTEVSCEAPDANAWLHAHLDRCNFWPTGQALVEKAFALGTGAWALSFDVGEDATAMKVRTYDARMVLPLSWDVDGVTECAFATRIMERGRPADQLQMHVLEGGRYVIRTALFVDGRPEPPERFGLLDEFDTGSPFPTFAIVRPGIENVRADVSPYGMSVFADAVDACKAVDLAYDALFQEIDLTEVMVFMDEAMIDVRTRDGKAVPVPRGPRNRIFRKLAGRSANEMYEVFSPQIRTEPIRAGLDVALAELGDQCGFGQQYFQLDKAGGLKTATEVGADNAALMRSIRKHERVLRGAIQDIASSMLWCAREHCGVPIEQDVGAVSVTFDDSIVTDTQTDKNQMLAEIAAGVAQPWEYRVRFMGESEEQARANAPQQPGADPFGAMGY